MNLVVVGCNHRAADVAARERLAIADDRLPAALRAAAACFGEAVILSTCNRVEIYAASDDQPAPDRDAVAAFLAGLHGLPPSDVAPLLYQHRDADAVRHCFRVVAGLDSLVLGEHQIAGQVKAAYEAACRNGAAGPLLHALFQHARRVAARVRAETGLCAGHASVAGAAVEYVRQVFDHFGDKTVLVIGAGKMGGLTLRRLAGLRPGRILIANRSTPKAQALATACGGEAIPWEKLDDALVRADIVLSTTGAAEPLVSRERYQAVLARRTAGTAVILDIAVPRDFDPRIHDGDRTCLFNIDDLKRLRDRTLGERRAHVGPAEEIVDQEVRRFAAEWARRRHGPVIARLTADLEAKRQAVLGQLLSRLNGRLTDDDRAQIEAAFRLLQNQFLHGPMSALAAEPADRCGHTLLDALRKLFGLAD